MKKIVIVEDNPDNRLLARAILEDSFQIVEFEDGPSAVEGLPRQRADLVLLDISLPGMDGVEVLSRIRDDPRLGHLPVIALTAHAMLGDREKFIACGFDGYVAKPIIDDTLLIRTIEGCLANAAGVSPEAAIAGLPGASQMHF